MEKNAEAIRMKFGMSTYGGRVLVFAQLNFKLQAFSPIIFSLLFVHSH